MQSKFTFLWLILLFPLLVHAKNQEQFVEGKDYKVLPERAQTLTKKDQIEVASAFWYGCPHCYTLETIMDSWSTSRTGDVAFVKVPTFFGPNIWKTHAQLYYALEAMNLDKKKLHTIHDAIFDEVQNNGNRLSDVNSISKYLNDSFEIDPKQFASYYNSFGVLNKLNQASLRIKTYGLEGVPALIVDGRYLVQPQPNVGLEKMPQVVDFLIMKVRNERNATPSQQQSQKSAGQG